jgi:type I restriction enzyme S subunit
MTDDEPRADDLSNYKVCQQGDIVLNRMRAFQGAIGISPLEGLVSPDYIVLHPTSSDPRFLHYLFRSHWFVGEMIARLRGIGSTDTGNVRTPRINAEDLGDIDVVAPSIGVQRAIAGFLDTETSRIDALIAKKRRLVDLLDERCVSVMRDGVRGAFTSKALIQASVPWIDLKGDGWKEGRLAYFARLGTGHTPSRDHPEWWIDCTIPWITTGEVAQMRDDRIEEISDTREKISESGLANSAAMLHPKGTVVLSRTASAGFSAIMATAMATSQDFVTWRCGPLLRPRFLLLCLRVMRQDLLGRLAMGSTHKTIYFPDIQSLRIVVPPIQEQDEVVEAVWRQLAVLHRAADGLADQIELLVEHRQALITAAVTGELEIPGVAA